MKKEIQQCIKRFGLLEAIRVRLAEAPVVALLGALQVGKTALAGQVAAAWPASTVVFDLWMDADLKAGLPLKRIWTVATQDEEYEERRLHRRAHPKDGCNRAKTKKP